MEIKKICVLGGTGFVGRYLVSALSSLGAQLRVLTRRREKHRELLVLPTVEVRSCDTSDIATLEQQFSQCDAVINLVGILNESGKQTFQRIHVELPHKIVEACKKAGVKRLLHMSALNAETRSVSKYLRSKGAGEKLVLQAQGSDLAVTCFKPSVIFGKGDDFFNRFKRLLSISPLVFPLACHKTKFAPVYVGDIANAFITALVKHDCFGQCYELCGPKEYTLRELITYLVSLTGQKRFIIGMGPTLSKMQARVLEFMPGKPFTRDNYLSMQVDSVCKEPFPEIFASEPVALESIVPSYIAGQSVRQQYQGYRRRARRS